MRKTSMILVLFLTAALGWAQSTPPDSASPAVCSSGCGLRLRVNLSGAAGPEWPEPSPRLTPIPSF